MSLNNKKSEDNSAEEYLFKALECQKEGNYQTAIEYIDKCLSFGLDEDAMCLKLVCLRELNLYEDLIILGDEILDINCENTLALNHMIEAYTKLGDYNRALIYLDQYISIDESAIKDKIIFLMKIGELNEAINLSKEVLERNPHDRDLYCHIGISYMGLEDYKNAQSYLLKAYDESTEEYVYYNEFITLSTLGTASYFNGELEISYKFLKEAYSINPYDLDVLELLCHVTLDMGKWIETIDYGNRLLKMSDNNEIFNIMALAYFKMGDEEKGLEYFLFASNSNDNE